MSRSYWSIYSCALQSASVSFVPKSTQPSPTWLDFCSSSISSHDPTQPSLVSEEGSNPSLGALDSIDRLVTEASEPAVAVLAELMFLSRILDMHRLKL